MNVGKWTSHKKLFKRCFFSEFFHIQKLALEYFALNKTCRCEFHRNFFFGKCLESYEPIKLQNIAFSTGCFQHNQNILTYNELKFGSLQIFSS